MKLENLKINNETKEKLVYAVNIIIRENIAINNCYNIWELKNGQKIFLGYGFI